MVNTRVFLRSTVSKALCREGYTPAVNKQGDRHPKQQNLLFYKCSPDLNVEEKAVFLIKNDDFDPIFCVEGWKFISHSGMLEIRVDNYIFSGDRPKSKARNLF